MRYAEVIVDLSAEAVDRLFTYSVPEGMEVDAGWQVEVPFGPRRLEGFVTSLKDECDLPPEKVRPILRALHGEPVILPELMDLAVWLRERCLCNLVDALRLMIPAQMRGERVKARTVRTAHLQDASVEIPERFSAQRSIVERLRQGDCPASEFSPQALRTLEKKGVVSISSSRVYRTPAAMRKEVHSDDPELTEEQRLAVERLNDALQTGGRFLLHGVTGSGKTEVYIRVIRRALETGRGAIVLVPEIALTPQMVGWLHGRFGASAAVLHSGLSAGERYDEWQRIRSGEARVVIGARSAVFAPVENLGVIVVDEEHETSYLSDRRPRYDAREVAWRRAERNHGVLLLGSATPSVSTYMRAMPGVRPENRLELIELRHRVNRRALPEVEVVDMREEFERGNRSVFSTSLARALRETLDRGQQALLFLNRRGHSSFVSCRACGYVIKCGQCDVSMTYHQRGEVLRCHYCGSQMPPPKVCPSCGSPYIKYFGTGTQKVEEEVLRRFPDARVVRVDMDTTQGKDAHQKLLEKFASGECNVMIGTQMIAKGLDFPHVTLAGVVAADMTLHLPDYRSAERTFQLITQVAGRAGRADEPGRVVVQTYDPDHYAVALAARQDYRGFYRKESEYRRKALYPPFTVIARVVCSAQDKALAQSAAEEIEREMNRFLDEGGYRRDVVQMRALEAPIHLLRGLARWQVFLKMYFKGDLEAVAGRMQALCDGVPEGVRAELEINPTNLF